MPQLHSQKRFIGLALLLLVFAAACSARAADKLDLETAKARFEKTVAAELERGIVPGFSVGWIIDGKLVHAAGYGMADAQKNIPAKADTIYRVGSISKLFNAVGAMQLVEQGKLDLDAPIQKALSEFSIVVPFESAEPLTIRQMLCHRSGMVREAPIGGYLDPNEPTLAATLASVAPCVLVNPPNTKTRYSNVGPSIVGRAVEVQTNMPFEQYQQQYVLGPLGMNSSAWRMNDELHPRLSAAVMRVNQGDGAYQIERAPEFELGTLPAGNLYSTVEDLAKFAAFVIGDKDASAEAMILKRETLDTMLTTQLDEAGGFGVGFRLRKYRDRNTVGHGGAVYGFSTSLVILPKERIGVIVLSNADGVSGRVRGISQASLDLLLEITEGEKTPEPEKPITLSPEELAAMAGEYESPSFWARLSVDGDKLKGDISGQPIELSPVAPLRSLAEGRYMHNAPVEFERDKSGLIVAFKTLEQRFTRVDPNAIPKPPEEWNKLLGSFGPKFIPLVVSIHHGHLYASVENEYDYRLQPINRATFGLSPGMYSDEQVVFQSDAAGNVVSVIMANMILPRNSQ